MVNHQFAHPLDTKYAVGRIQRRLDVATGTPVTTLGEHNARQAAAAAKAKQRAAEEQARREARWPGGL